MTRVEAFFLLLIGGATASYMCKYAVRTVFNRSKEAGPFSESAGMLARKILDQEGCGAMEIFCAGNRSSYFDLLRNAIGLGVQQGMPLGSSRSALAYATVLHEIGHALQCPISVHGRWFKEHQRDAHAYALCRFLFELYRFKNFSMYLPIMFGVFWLFGCAEVYLLMGITYLAFNLVYGVVLAHEGDAWMRAETWWPKNSDISIKKYRKLAMLSYWSSYIFVQYAMVIIITFGNWYGARIQF